MARLLGQRRGAKVTVRFYSSTLIRGISENSQSQAHLGAAGRHRVSRDGNAITHQDIAHALKAKIFFATPYHAWERGLNENTNGLIRDFFPKGTDFSTISNAEVAKVERLLNARPRKSLGFRSPQEVFHSLAYS